MVRDFDEFLSRDRGLTRDACNRYCFFVRRFLDKFCGTAAPDWSSLRGEDITAFVQRESLKLKRNAREAPGTAIRALLRYLVFIGAVGSGLECAVPRMRRWKQSALPRYLSMEEIQGVINGVLNDSPKGRRNYAMLLLLARTGLRAGEVADLMLGDINWTEGTLYIKPGKSRRERCLPLAQDVGAALYNYLKKGRPRCKQRNVFLRAVPPFEPFRNSAAVRKIARRALIRAGIIHGPIGSHLFRHSAATGMLRGGASFKEIADVLGHASINTTAIYAKLDLSSLSRVAMPWPGSAP